MNARPSDWRAYTEERGGIQELLRLHAQMDIDILKMRQNLPMQAGALEAAWTRIQEIEERVFADARQHAGKTKRVSPGQTDKRSLVLDYYVYKGIREERVSQFVNMNAAVAAAGGLALRELDAVETPAQGSAGAAGAVRTSFLRYLHDATETTAKSVQADLAAFTAGRSEDEHAVIAANNIEYVLRQVPQLDGLLLELVNEPATPLQEMLAAQSRQYAERYRQQEIYRIVLLAYAALLLLGSLALAIRLRNRGVTQERNVDERARKLAEVYEELKQSQLQMMQSEKMASLGQMVAGMAHEINTPLGFSRSNVEMVRELLSDQARVFAEVANGQAGTEEAAVLERVRQAVAENPFGEMDELLEAARQGLGQISELVDGLRAFSRLDRSKVDRVDLNRGIDDVLRIARNTLSKCKAEVHRQNGELPLVSCVPSQINQVLLNLIVNAAQALPEAGGTIAIETRTNDRFIEIIVEDDGCGMPQEVISRIFDPFFTTKEIGKGTGLGLSIAYQIVREHGGAITVDSIPDEGTRFIISLPVVSA